MKTLLTPENLRGPAGNLESARMLLDDAAEASAVVASLDPGPAAIPVSALMQGVTFVWDPIA